MEAEGSTLLRRSCSLTHRRTNSAPQLPPSIDSCSASPLCATDSPLCATESPSHLYDIPSDHGWLRSETWQVSETPLSMLPTPTPRLTVLDTVFCACQELEIEGTATASPSQSGSMSTCALEPSLGRSVPAPALKGNITLTRSKSQPLSVVTDSKRLHDDREETMESIDVAEGQIVLLFHFASHVELSAISVTPKSGVGTLSPVEGHIQASDFLVRCNEYERLHGWRTAGKFRISKGLTNLTSLIEEAPENPVVTAFAPRIAQTWRIILEGDTSLTKGLVSSVSFRGKAIQEPSGSEVDTAEAQFVSWMSSLRADQVGAHERSVLEANVIQHQRQGFHPIREACEDVFGRPLSLPEREFLKAVLQMPKLPMLCYIGFTSTREFRDELKNEVNEENEGNRESKGDEGIDRRNEESRKAAPPTAPSKRKRRYDFGSVWNAIERAATGYFRLECFDMAKLKGFDLEDKVLLSKLKHADVVVYDTTPLTVHSSGSPPDVLSSPPLALAYLLGDRNPPCTTKGCPRTGRIGTRANPVPYSTFSRIFHRAIEDEYRQHGHLHAKWAPVLVLPLCDRREWTLYPQEKKMYRLCNICAEYADFWTTNEANLEDNYYLLPGALPNQWLDVTGGAAEEPATDGSILIDRKVRAALAWMGTHMSPRAEKVWRSVDWPKVKAHLAFEKQHLRLGHMEWWIAFPRNHVIALRLTKDVLLRYTSEAIEIDGDFAWNEGRPEEVYHRHETWGGAETQPFKVGK